MLALSAFPLALIVFAPSANAAVPGATVTMDYPLSSTGASTVTRTVYVSNPTGNPDITHVTISIPTAAVGTGGTVNATFPTSGSGIPTGATISVFGTGPWAVVVDKGTAGAVDPAGAKVKFTITLSATESATAVSGTADTFSFTVAVVDSSGATSTLPAIAFVETAATAVTQAVAPSTTTPTAGTPWTFSVSTSDTGIPLIAFVSTGTASKSTISPSSFVTGSSAQQITVTSTKAQTVAVKVDVAKVLDTASTSAGTLTALTETVTVQPGPPTQVVLGLSSYDSAGYLPDYASALTSTVTMSLADKYGNIVSTGVTGTASLTVLAGKLTCSGSCASVAVSGGAFTSNPTYTAQAPTATHPLAYGTFDLISASLTVTAPSALAGTYSGSSNQISIGYLGGTNVASTNPGVVYYDPSGTPVVGSTIGLTYSVGSGTTAQASVPINFSLTSTSTTTPYAGTFSNGKSWIVIMTNSAGSASANFTADTTVGHNAYAKATVPEPTTASPTTTATQTTGAAVGASVVGKATQLKIRSFSDNALTVPQSYASPSGKLYLDVSLADKYGNTVTNTLAFALQITLATSAGGLSSTTVYINSGQSDTQGSAYPVQFTAPTTLGDVTISASTTQTGITSASKIIHVVSINPTVSLTKPATTALTKNTVSVNATGVPSLASAAGTVVVTFKYSLNGAANVTTGITSTNSSGASFTSFTVSLLNGTNTLKIYATDSNGNVGVGTFTFTVTHPPPVTFSNSFQVQGTPAKAIIGSYTGIKANYTNKWTSAESAVVFAVWKNSAGQTVAVTTGGLSLGVGATGTAFMPLLAALPTGTYTVNVFVWTTGNNPVSITTTISVTV